MPKTSFFRFITALAFLIPLSSYGADFRPGSQVFLYGKSGDVQFSEITTPPVPWLQVGPPPRPAPTYITQNGSDYEFHGNVWIDRSGWMTFDYGAGEKTHIAESCIENLATTVCPIDGYAWGKYAGWIEFHGNNPSLGVNQPLYDKLTGTLRGSAWSEIVGWVPLDGIEVWLTPIGPGYQPNGFNEHMTTTGSAFLPAPVPPYVLQRCTNGACVNFTLTIYPISDPSISQTVPYDRIQGGFPNVDLSIATDYRYIIRDPFGSETEGTIRIFANAISINPDPLLASNDLIIERYCRTHGGNVLCPDGSTVSQSRQTGNLGGSSGPKLADLIEEYSGIIRLRDRYGNPIQDDFTLAGTQVKDVVYTVTLDSTIGRNSIAPSQSYLYQGLDTLGMTDFAHRYKSHGSALLEVGLGGSLANRAYPGGVGANFNLLSYAPSSTGNPTGTVQDNDIRISSITGSVVALPPYTGDVGSGSLDITSVSQTNPLVFLPIYSVTSLSGFADIQMGRPTPLGATIDRANTTQTIGPPTVIHGLSITTGSLKNLVASFQDFDPASLFPTGSTISYIMDAAGAASTPYIEYRDRRAEGAGRPASVIAFPGTTSTRQTNSFTTIPRRLLSVNLEQSYGYDSVITYFIEVDGIGKEVIYPSLAQSTVGTADKIFANAVKILGQASGNQIYQTLTAMPQPKTNNLSRADIINAVKKNVAILTRNVTFAGGTDYAAPNINVYKRNLSLSTPSNILSDKQTIVAYGDITIGTGFIVGNLADKPRVIIALRDENGNGGNIFIQSGASRIDASLITERSVISGDNSSGTPRYYVTESSATGTLNRQLYIFGSVFSENTIGGAAKDGSPTCPKSITEPCTDFVPLIYDLEHFRYYRFDSIPTFPAPLARGAANMSTEDKKSSLIIEYDARILSSPPPGLENITN